MLRKTAGNMVRLFILGSVILEFLLLLTLFNPVITTSVDAEVDTNDPSKLVKVWEYRKTDTEATFWKLAWAPDGSMVAATFFDNTCIVLNASDGSVLKELDLNPTRGIGPGTNTRCDGFAPEGTLPLRACAFSPDGKYLALGGDERKVIVLNVGTWDRKFTLLGHTGSILCLDFSPDGNYLASGSGTDKVIPQNEGENITRIWDLTNGAQVLTLQGHADGVLGVRWSHAGDRLATVSDDRKVTIWSFPVGEPLMTMTGHTSGVLDVDWTPDDTRVITGSRDYKIKVWDAQTGELLATWGDNNCVRSVDIHPTAEIVATGGVDLTLKIRDLNTGTSLKVIKDGVAQHAMIMSSRWSPDGSALVSGLGKSHSVIMYRFSGTKSPAQAVNPFSSGTLTAIILIIISVVFLVVLFYPVRKKLRSRRG